MALFTDGSISALDDLSAQDSQLLDIASAEGINVTQKIALAQNEIGLELEAMLRGLQPAGWPRWCIQAPQLGQIVVTPALKLWHIYYTLEMVYRDAYSDQLNDRFAAKRDQFHQLAKTAREKLLQIGIGIAANPVDQAATPTIIAVSGGLPDGTYYVTMAWVNQGWEEGASAVPEAITVTASTFQVQPAAPPANATGWNVYAGVGPQAMFLQNTTLIAANGAWLQPADLAIEGATPGAGQQPTYLRPVPRVLQRG